MKPIHERLIAEGYTFDMQAYFSEGWQLFKKQAGSFIGYSLIYFVISFAAAFTIGLIPVLGSFATQILGYCLIGGAYVFARNSLTTEAEFSQLFDGFKELQRLAVHYLFMLLFVLPILIPIFLLVGTDLLESNFQNLEEVEYILDNIGFTAILTGVALLIYLAVLYTLYALTIPIIMEHKEYSAWQAMELSRKIVSKKLFAFISFYVIIIFLSVIASVLTCFLYAFLMAIPLYICFNFAAYRQIVQPDLQDLSNQIDLFGAGENDINTESQE